MARRGVVAVWDCLGRVKGKNALEAILGAIGRGITVWGGGTHFFDAIIGGNLHLGGPERDVLLLEARNRRGRRWP